jgi:hypothetical protein
LFRFWFRFSQRPNPKRGPPHGPILGATLLLYEGTGATRRPPFPGSRQRFPQFQATESRPWSNFMRARVPYQCQYQYPSQYQYQYPYQYHYQNLYQYQRWCQ